MRCSERSQKGYQLGAMLHWCSVEHSAEQYGRINMPSWHKYLSCFCLDKTAPQLKAIFANFILRCQRPEPPRRLWPPP